MILKKSFIWKILIVETTPQLYGNVFRNKVSGEFIMYDFDILEILRGTRSLKLFSKAFLSFEESTLFRKPKRLNYTVLSIFFWNSFELFLNIEDRESALESEQRNPDYFPLIYNPNSNEKAVAYEIFWHSFCRELYCA